MSTGTRSGRTARAAGVRPAPVPAAAVELLAAAALSLGAAEEAGTPAQRFVRAHLGALRAAAAVLAARARPGPRRSRIRSVWVLLPRVAPELADWAAFFEAGAGKRAAAEAGLEHAVAPREADDLVREAGAFLDVVAAVLGVSRVQQPLPVAVPGCLRPTG